MSENKDWKPEVGKTACVVVFNNVYEMLITEILGEDSPKPGYKGTIWQNPWTNECNPEISSRDIYPTAEAALASIKVYDLEGKEVVIPRAEAKIGVTQTDEREPSDI